MANINISNVNDEVNGKVVPEEWDSQNDKDKSEWLGEKSSLIYDMEDQSLDFSRLRPTDWKTNKRITLPKGGSKSLEAFLEICRNEASRIFDKCEEVLGYNPEKDKNLKTSQVQGDCYLSN